MYQEHQSLFSKYFVEADFKILHFFFYSQLLYLVSVTILKHFFNLNSEMCLYHILKLRGFIHEFIALMHHFARRQNCKHFLYYCLNYLVQFFDYFQNSQKYKLLDCHPLLFFILYLFILHFQFKSTNLKTSFCSNVALRKNFYYYHYLKYQFTLDFIVFSFKFELDQEFFNLSTLHFHHLLHPLGVHQDFD